MATPSSLLSPFDRLQTSGPWYERQEAAKRDDPQTWHMRHEYAPKQLPVNPAIYKQPPPLVARYPRLTFLIISLLAIALTLAIMAAAARGNVGQFIAQQLRDHKRAYLFSALAFMILSGGALWKYCRAHLASEAPKLRIRIFMDKKLGSHFAPDFIATVKAKNLNVEFEPTYSFTPWCEGGPAGTGSLDGAPPLRLEERVLTITLVFRVEEEGARALDFKVLSSSPYPYPLFLLGFWKYGLDPQTGARSHSANEQITSQPSYSRLACGYATEADRYDAGAARLLPLEPITSKFIDEFEFACGHYLQHADEWMEKARRETSAAAKKVG